METNIKLKYVQLHSPLFISGTNFGNTIELSKRTNVTLTYNRREKELLVYFKNEVAIVPFASVLAMIPINPEDIGYPANEKQPTKQPAPQAQVAPVQAEKQLKAQPKVSAQVSGPSQHVFADAPGKVRD